MIEGTRWRQIQELFKQAVNLPRDERSSFLTDACGADTELYDQVNSLLQHDEQAMSSFMELTEVLPADAPAPTSDGAIRSPQIRGYHLLRIVGRGGMGVVYEAEQEKLNRRVALKFLPQLLTSVHPEFVTRFRREAAAAARLHHANIIPIYDYGECPDGYYYAMELLDGMTMDRLIERLRSIDPAHASIAAIADILGDGEAAKVALPHVMRSDATNATRSVTGSGSHSYYRQVARWMADAADALHYAHVRGLVHRDIKPSNLMVCSDGRLMVLDFGLVKAPGDASVTITGSLLGSYRYMSPEQIGAQRIPIDARTDVYSLGVTMYEMLALRPAFDAVERPELLGQILFDEPTPLRRIAPHVPGDLQTICFKAMEKSPRARYATAKELADDLDRYLCDLAISARPPQLMRRIGKFVRRRRFETMTAVTAMLLIIAIAFGIHARHRQLEQARIDGLDQAWTYVEQEDWESAQSQLDSLSGRYPADYGVLATYASMFENRYWATKEARYLDDARRLAEAARAVNAERPEAHNILGAICQAEGQFDAALEEYGRAIGAYDKAESKDSGYFAAFTNMAITHAMRGHLSEANRCAKEGVKNAKEAKRGAKNDEAYIMPFRIRAAIQMQCNFLDALDAINESLEVSDSRDVHSLILAAQYYLRRNATGDDRRALNYANMAESEVKRLRLTNGDTYQAQPDDFRTKSVSAIAQLRNGHLHGARDAAEEAINMSDELGSQAYTPALAYFVSAIASAKLGDAKDAEQSFSRAMAAWPERLKSEGFIASDDGKSLWFDTHAELCDLCVEAAGALDVDAAQCP